MPSRERRSWTSIIWAVSQGPAGEGRPVLPLDGQRETYFEALAHSWTSGPDPRVSKSSSTPATERGRRTSTVLPRSRLRPHPRQQRAQRLLSPRPRAAAAERRQTVSAIVKVIGADAGFLLNSDVSRVSIVSETGETLSEEYTFPLVADRYLARRPGPVITNASRRPG